MGDFRPKCQHLIEKKWSEMKIQLEVKVYTKPNSQNMATDGGINVCEAKPTLQAQSINPPIELFLLLSKMQ